MSYLVSGKLTFDNPNRAGRTTTWGIGRDWEPAEPRVIAPSFSVAQNEPTRWQYKGQFEFIEGVNCIAPLGRAVQTDMSFFDFRINSGKWRLTSLECWGEARRLHFYDNRPGLYAQNKHGDIATKASWAPNIRVWLWRRKAPKGDTEPAVVSIELLGSGGAPAYGVWLPAWGLSSEAFKRTADEENRWFRHPLLLRRIGGAGTWEVIDELQQGAAPQAMEKGGQMPAFQVISIEYLPPADVDNLPARQGFLVIRISGVDKPWVYSAPDLNVTTGAVRVRLMGHTGGMLFQPLEYPTSAVLVPTQAFYVPGQFSQTPAYHVVSNEPSGTSISVTTETVAPNWTRPNITFTTTDPHLRAALYCVQEYRTPTIGDVSTAETTTQDSTDFRLEEMSGNCNDKWRGASMDATLRMQTSQALTGNQWVQAKASVDGGTNEYVQFTGHIVPPTKEKSDALGSVTASLHATDPLDSNLSKHPIFWQPSFEGWDVRSVFSYLLNCGGVPDANISIDAAVPATLMMPTGAILGDRKWKFDIDTPIPSALDRMMTAVGLEWGVDENGTYFLRYPAQHVTGAYDFLLDDDTTTEEDMVLSFRAVKSIEEFWNVLVVLVGEGPQMRGKFNWEDASMSDSSASDFIGADWWHIERHSDSRWVTPIYDELWRKRDEANRLIYWRTMHHPELMPGDEVKVQVSDCNVPTDTIFRITSKAWRISDLSNEGRYEAEFEGVVVEEGP